MVSIALQHHSKQFLYEKMLIKTRLHIKNLAAVGLMSIICEKENINPTETTRTGDKYAEFYIFT
jgi:hypothetical protein